MSDQGSRLQGHGVRNSGRPQPSFVLGSTEGTPGTALCKGPTPSDTSVNAWAERSCSQRCSQTADFADVREGSPASKSLASPSLRRRLRDLLIESDDHLAKGGRKGQHLGGTEWRDHVRFLLVEKRKEFDHQLLASRGQADDHAPGVIGVNAPCH